jgi:hypothetical protein
MQKITVTEASFSDEFFLKCHKIYVARLRVGAQGNCTLQLFTVVIVTRVVLTIVIVSVSDYNPSLTFIGVELL